MFRSKVPHWLTLKVKRTIYLIVVFSTPRAAERRFMGDFFTEETADLELTLLFKNFIKNQYFQFIKKG